MLSQAYNPTQTFPPICSGEDNYNMVLTIFFIFSILVNDITSSLTCTVYREFLNIVIAISRSNEAKAASENPQHKQWHRRVPRLATNRFGLNN